MAPAFRWSSRLHSRSSGVVGPVRSKIDPVNDTRDAAAIESAKEDLLRSSVEILNAICAHDAEALAAYLASDFVLLTAFGRQERAAFLDGARTGEFVALDAGFDCIEAEVLGTVAVVAGVQRVEVELADGSRAVSRGAFTDVFVREGENWLLRVAHTVELE
jgi:ketosteroid isomerase-like protein